MGKIYEFTTALPPGDKTPYKFAVFGDSGYTDQTRKTSSQMVEQKQKNDIRYIMHYGDLSYANGIVSYHENFVSTNGQITNRQLRKR